MFDSALEKIHKSVCYLCKELTLFFIGGFLYVLVEMLWRGHSHWTMNIVGGICFTLIGLINELFTYEMALELQCLISSLVVTAIEYLSGLIINVTFELNVWDYSSLPLNIDGQICLLFAFLWFLLAIPAIIADDFIRWWIFNEPMKKYNVVTFKLLSKLFKKKENE
jgi:uncharacterized membrane protein